MFKISLISLICILSCFYISRTPQTTDHAQTHSHLHIHIPQFMNIVQLGKF